MTGTGVPPHTVDPVRREELRKIVMAHDSVADAEPFTVVPASFASAVEIRNHLRANDAEADTPRIVALFQELPRAADGTVAVGPLAELLDGLDETQISEFLPPQTESETAICELVGAVTGASWVGALDDFIDLGGTSVDTVQLSSRIYDRFGVTLSLEEIFDASTPRSIAGLVEAGG
jgi:hypothetical protein